MFQCFPSGVFCEAVHGLAKGVKQAPDEQEGEGAIGNGKEIDCRVTEGGGGREGGWGGRERERERGRERERERERARECEREREIEREGQRERERREGEGEGEETESGWKIHIWYSRK